MARELLVRGVVVAYLLGFSPITVAAQSDSSQFGARARVGSVNFEISGHPEAQVAFNRGVALLHSFEFGPAMAEFRAVLAVDSECAMAYWGIALCRWGNPFAPGLKPVSLLQQGREAVRAGEAANPKTQRERDYIASVARLYDNFETTSQQSRVNAYCSAMSKVAARYPADTEATIFYALSLSASADLADKTYTKQLKAGAILEALFRKMPRHPGVAHYIIHTYDFPPLAPRALTAARTYAEIAPDSPHALHMPSHIFTRLGLWDESIASNVASRAISRREGNVTEELHASDYLVYAYLQSGRDSAAKRILKDLPEIESHFDPTAIPVGAAPVSAAFFAMAAIPARYALEREDWLAASRLQVRTTQYRYTDAITWFARGLGAAHIGDIVVARFAARQLADIHERLIESKESYWALQVEIQRLDVLAWAALAAKDSSDALRLMHQAVRLEDRTEKSAVTPGPIAPARELLGEMFLLLDRPGSALEEFEATLKKEPNRFRALTGAAKAAELAGNSKAAQHFATTLLRVCARADSPGRPELAELRAIANAMGVQK
jgi:hypothetical protein